MWWSLQIVRVQSTQGMPRVGITATAGPGDNSGISANIQLLFALFASLAASDFVFEEVEIQVLISVN